MIHTLKNDLLSIKVKSKGAELCSLVNNKTGLEYIWQAEEAWPKHAPILFPFVGKLKNDTYYYQDKNYSSTQHGFARDLEFEFSHSTANTLTFSLTSNTGTLEKYPFNFKLEISYHLIGNLLKVEAKVTNTGADKMYFSIGFHPAFKVPLINTTTYNDYYLQFDQVEEVDKWPVDGGLIGNPREKVLDKENRLPLTHDLFKDDALVIKDLKSERISLKSKKTPHGFDFIFKDFPFFGIWAKGNGNFVCLEPWQGIADSTISTQQLKDKEGIRLLTNNEQFVCGYEVIVF